MLSAFCRYSNVCTYVQELLFIHKCFIFFLIGTKHRHRHNSNSNSDETLTFRFNNIAHSVVIEAYLNLFVLGEAIMHQNASSLPPSQNLTITVHRVIRKEKMYTQLVNTYEGSLPKGKGKYIQVNVTSMVSEWFRSPHTNFGTYIKIYGNNVILNPSEEENVSIYLNNLNFSS